MAFSLACDTYRITLRIEGTDSSVTWNDVANSGAGSVVVDGGGVEDPSFFVTEHVANGIYQILKNIQFGDGSNALTFYSKNEMVYFDDDQIFTIKDFATLQLGEISGGNSINGASWSWEKDGEIIPEYQGDASCKIYGSRMHFRGTGFVDFMTGAVDFRNSIFQADDVANAKARINAPIAFTLKSLYINNWCSWALTVTPDTIEGIWVHHTVYGLLFYQPVTIEDLLVTDGSTSKIFLSSGVVINLVNPQWNIVRVDVMIINPSGVLYRKYTCNIHVVDEDGGNLEGVTITCKDKYNNQVFSVQTGTDGKIVQQIVTYKKWQGTGETETEYSPHKFTFSKNGYTLLVMENVTVDTRINWDIEVKFPERIRARMANLSRLAILR